MKRNFLRFAAVTAALFLLCGCGKQTAMDPITDGFTAQAAIRYKEMDVQGQFSCSADGRVTMAFTRPNTLAGVTFGWNGSEMQMKLGSMTIAVAQDSMPDGGLVQCLTRVLASVEPNNGELDGGDYVIRGEAEGVAYTLVCDAATGLPKTLSVPEEQLTAEFTQVTKL